MKFKAWLQWGVALIRWFSIKLATVIRWASVLAIAVGLGIAVVHVADEQGFVPTLLFYCVFPGAVGLFLAHLLDEFGRHQDEG
jgi:hypothetical protein